MLPNIIVNLCFRHNMLQKTRKKTKKLAVMAFGRSALTVNSSSPTKFVFLSGSIPAVWFQKIRVINPSKPGNEWQYPGGKQFSTECYPWEGDTGWQVVLNGLEFLV